jgi:hypothetical protein
MSGHVGVHHIVHPPAPAVVTSVRLGQTQSNEKSTMSIYRMLIPFEDAHHLKFLRAAGGCRSLDVIVLGLNVPQPQAAQHRGRTRHL